MSERLDLSGFAESNIHGGIANTRTGLLYDDRILFREALRAQASEDALKERVRVLEDKLAEIVDLGSVLPMIITENGADGESIIETLICDSIAGGARYANDMPLDLHLTRCINGKTIRMKYEQARKGGR